MDQMQYRCPDAVPLGTATLQGWELLFRGSKTGSYLTIERNPGAETPIALWRVSDADECRLDRYEGYPNFYYKLPLRVRYRDMDGNKRRARCFVYVMHEDRPLGLPSYRYMQTCGQGYQDFGFDQQILLDAYWITKNRMEKEVSV